MRKFKRLTMTLALLIMAVGGAWADGTVYNTTVALKDLKAGDVLTDGFKLTSEKGQYIYVKGYKKDGGTAETSDYTQLNADNSTFPGGVTISESGSTYTPYADGKDANAWIVNDWKDLGSAIMLYLDGYNYTPTEWSLTPDKTGKTWTLAKMPASDIELQVEYFAESNLFLSKDALADKANIAVTAGETTVEFGDDGKSANTVTEGTPMTVTYNGTKKVLGMKVEKGGGEPVLLTTITAADNSSFKSGSQTFGDVATVTLTGEWLINDGSHGGWYCTGSNLTATISVAEANGANITSVKFYTAGGGSAEDKEAPFEVTTTSMSSSDITTYLNGNAIGSYGVSKIEVYGTK